MSVFDKCALFISQTNKEDDMYSIMNVLVTTLLCKDECTKNKWFHRVNFVISRHTTSRKHVMTSGWL